MGSVLSQVGAVPGLPDLRRSPDLTYCFKWHILIAFNFNQWGIDGLGNLHMDGGFSQV